MCARILIICKVLFCLVSFFKGISILVGLFSHQAILVEEQQCYYIQQISKGIKVLHTILKNINQKMN